MYKLNFNHLHYFLTIAREGSIVKASKKLNLTQPALSHQLRLLEEDLGKKLFDRVGKRLILNSYGESVESYASKIFRHSEEMIQSLKTENKNFLRIIKIGTVPWIPKEKIYEIIKPLLFSPHIQIEIYQKELETLIKDVQGNRIEIVLCDSPYSGRSSKLQGHRIFTDPIYCVSARKTGYKGNFPKSIEGKNAIVYSEASLLTDKIDAFLKTNKVSIRKVGAFSDLTLIKTSVQHGGVLSFLPASEVKIPIKEKKLYKIGELKNIKFSLWAITRKDYKEDGIVANILKKTKKN